MTRWSQFVILGLAQLAGRTSLRDVVSNLKAQAGKLYQLDCGEVNRSSLARKLDLPGGSIVVFDRGYTDYCWHNQLNSKGIYFITRQKKNICYTAIKRRPASIASVITSDQTIRLTSTKTHQRLVLLHRIGYRDPEIGKHYVFLTNAHHLAVSTIAAIYKGRSQIELFFKWIKRNLKIKYFLGTSRNAVMTRIWVAICMYLLLAYIRFMSKLGMGMQQILHLLQLNLFESRDLNALLRGDPPEPRFSPLQTQLQLA